MAEPVLSTLDDGVLTLTLNRPEKRNALNEAMIDQLHAALDRADLASDVRVVAIRGAGKDFCAGADLGELLATADRSLEQNERAAWRLGSLFLRLRQLPRPTVAVVQGRAFAGGAGLATACDIVLAAEGAQLAYPEVQRGFVPAMVLTMLRRQVGERVAFHLVATGRVLTAAQAAQAGLISQAIPNKRLNAEAADVLKTLAALSPTALALTKKLLYELDGRGFEEGIRLGARVNAAARASDEFRAAVQKFLDR